MQKIYAPLVLLLILALSACSSSDRPNPPASSDDTGEWLWLAQLDDGTEYSGYLSVSAELTEYDDVKDAQGGAWRWCEGGDVDNCPGVDGAGLISNIYADGAWRLTTSFANTNNDVKLIAIDNDNTIGTETEGQPTFLGGGIWYETTGDKETVSFGMVKLASAPYITSTASPVVIHSVKENLSAQTLESAKLGSEEAFAQSLEALFLEVTGE